MKILALLILLISCGQPAIENPGSPMVRETSDTLLKPYLDTFIQKLDCFERTPEYSSLRMTINWEGMDVAGKCITYTDRSAVILIDGPTWISISDVNRERLVYHEMGHCALELEHVDQSFEPELMTPTLREVLSSNYVADYDSIIRELFSNGPTDCAFSFQSYPDPN